MKKYLIDDNLSSATDTDLKKSLVLVGFDINDYRFRYVRKTADNMLDFRTEIKYNRLNDTIEED